MKNDFPLKTLLVGSAILTMLYLAAFYGFEAWQHRLGPWVVDFAADPAGQPSVTISQSKLQIAAVELRFPGETLAATNAPGRIVFDQLGRQPPFGRVIYEDLRSHPGVVTLDLFGHEIELLPRVLVVNRREIPWRREHVISLAPIDKPAQPPQPPKRRR